MGVPQGNVWFVRLFSIKINDIVKNINNGTNCALFMNYFFICYRVKKHEPHRKKTLDLPW